MVAFASGHGLLLVGGRHELARLLQRGALRQKLQINLALQGGGAHGAFTWGVLDRLLEEPARVAWISATSAGAVNAVALAAGLLDGERQAAREKLCEVWQAVHKAGVPDLTRLNPFLFGLSQSARMSPVASFGRPMISIRWASIRCGGCSRNTSTSRRSAPSPRSSF